MNLREKYEGVRSVNFFDTRRKIGGSILKNIINLALLVPSAFNLQPCKIIAFESADPRRGRKGYSDIRKV